MVPEPDHIGNKKLQLRASELRGARDQDEFDLHELALEWGLSEPIVIHDESDIKAKASWKDNLEPFEHQVQNLITFCRRLPVSIIADDVGLGKTGQRRPRPRRTASEEGRPQPSFAQPARNAVRR